MRTSAAATAPIIASWAIRRIALRQRWGRSSRSRFFAYQVFPGDVGTYGGVITDISARVLREDGSVIPGLYATGISTASVMGRAYPGAGASVGPSFVWGYIAARHAMECARSAADVAPPRSSAPRTEAGGVV